MVESNIQAITKFKKMEMDRQYLMKKERLDACSGYAKENVAKIKTFVEKYSTELKDQKSYFEDKRFEILMSEIQEYIEATKTHVNQVRKCNSKKHFYKN